MYGFKHLRMDTHQSKIIRKRNTNRHKRLKGWYMYVLLSHSGPGTVNGRHTEVERLGGKGVEIFTRSGRDKVVQSTS